MAAPLWFWCVTAFAFGITIGSFLNVVIWRLPRASKDVNLAKPAWSFCPKCEHRLSALDLVPLFSFLALGQKCRYCKAPISWRYFSVELLTGVLFVALTLRYQHDAPNCIALLLFTATLIPIYFIDLATFHIQDSLNLTVFGIAIARDIWGIAQHEPGHELLWGWLPRSILGAVVGVLIFGIVRVVGWMWKGVEAMGLGDVLLARAMGAMLVSLVPAGDSPLRLFMVWFLLSCFSGVIVGPALIWQRTRNAAPVAEEEPEPFKREGTLADQLLVVGWCLILGDALLYIRALFDPRFRENVVEEDDDFVPAPTAIPFGPFMIVGFLATAFIGEPMTAWYLAYALPRPQTLPAP